MMKNPHHLYYRSSTTIGSYPPALSTSPRNNFTGPPLKGIRRENQYWGEPSQYSADRRTGEKPEQHTIKDKEEFEEAVSSVFEDDLAHKSLERKGRVTKDILLDNHAWGSQKV